MKKLLIIISILASYAVFGQSESRTCIESGSVSFDTELGPERIICTDVSYIESIKMLESYYYDIPNCIYNNMVDSIYRVNMIMSIEKNNVTASVSAWTPVQIPFYVAVQMGMIDGHRYLDKFGANTNITVGEGVADVWQNGGVLPRDAFGTAPITSIGSTNASDAQQVVVGGLLVDGKDTSMLLTLNGNTRLDLPEPLWVSYRVTNNASDDFLGNVFVYTGTGAIPSQGDSEVRVMANGRNQSLKTAYTIPSLTVGFLTRGEGGMSWEGGAFSGTEEATILYKSARVGKVFTGKKLITLITTGESSYTDERVAPDPIPALTDIKISCEAVSATMGIWATFDILLVDESFWGGNTEYLQSIGQPGY